MASLLAHQTEPVCLWLFLKGFSRSEIQQVKKTGGDAEIRLVDIDLSPYLGFRALGGSHVPYARLSLPALVPVERLLYLDADVLCLTNLIALWNTNLGDAPAAMKLSGPMDDFESEWKIHQAEGYAPTDPYYNSGVLLMDLKRWREQKVTDRCLAFGKKYARFLYTADQACLNGAASRDIYELDRKWNTPLHPATVPLPEKIPPAIYHFVGSPKPWEILAFLVHRSFPLFYHYLRKSAGTGSLWRNYLNPENFKRLRRLLPAYQLAWRDRHQSALPQK